MSHYNNRSPWRGVIDGEAQPISRLLAFPSCGIEGWAGAAAIAAAAVGAGATAYSANKAASSQHQANDQNLSQFNLARGAGGNAVLPDYLGGFESSLGGDLTKAYADTAVPLGDFRAAAGKLAPAQDNATKFAGDIFNGGVTNRLLTNAAPVMAARTATARSSSLDALHKTLDSIDATQASRGYIGDSYGSRLLKFSAGTQAGNTIGAANMENAQQGQDIRNYGDVTLPMNNMTLPFNMAKSNADFQFLPSDAFLQSVSQRMQPLSMLKLGYTGPFQSQPLPVAGPSAGVLGGAAGALGSLAGVASGADALTQQKNFQQQLLDAIRSGQTSPTQTPGPMDDPNAIGSPFFASLANSGGADAFSGFSGAASNLTLNPN